MLQQSAQLLSPRWPTVTEASADCSRCELKPQCDIKKRVYAYQPPPNVRFNGIMIVGEGPGRSEVQQGRPFVGASGKLLRALCDSIGINLDECFVTNATSCLPRTTDGLAKEAPTAVHACLKRLEQEIALVQPRVIIALGNAALEALTGTETHGHKQIDAPWCSTCNGGYDLKRVYHDRKVIGVQCAACKHVHHLTVGLDQAQDDGTLKHLTPHMLVGAKLKDLPATFVPQLCPKEGCGATWKRLSVRLVACPTCEGYKKVQVPHVDFSCEYKIGEVAGAVIPAAKHGWDEFGVKYIVPTYHPSFVLRPPQGVSGTGLKRIMGGQFAAKPVQKHLRKALHLVTHDETWSSELEVTDPENHSDAAAHLLEYIYGDASVKIFSCDIETKALGHAYVCQAMRANKLGKENKCGNKGATFSALKQGLPESWGLYCEKCEKRTPHAKEAAELDARELTEVTEIFCVGFASRKRGYSLVVDTRTLDWKDEANPLFQALAKVLEDPKVEKIFHHGNYDAPTLYKIAGIQVQGYTHDTLIMHHDLYPDERHALSHVAFSYTYAPIWKPPKNLHGREAHESWEEECDYNARDTMLTYDVWEHMRVRLAPKKLDQVYALDMELQDQALEMWRTGMLLDVEAARKVGGEALTQQRNATHKMREILHWPDFNPNSGAQLAEAMYQRLGNPINRTTDGGMGSTDKEAILLLPDTPFKRELLQCKAGGVILRNYFDVIDGTAEPGRSLFLWGDGRIRAVWQCFGARTGRFSSSPNFQNWMQWLKAMIKAARGRRICGSDYDQLELRILAWLSGDPVLINKCMTADDSRKLEPEHDPHSFVAMHAFGRAFTDLLLKDPAHDKENRRCRCQTCERKSLRDIVKRVIYGLNYGAGDMTVLEAIYDGGYNGPPITLAMLARVRVTIFKTFEGIPIFQKQLYDQAMRDQAVRAPLLPRHRIFPLGDVPITEVYNFPIQSSAANIINQRNTILRKELRLIDPTIQYMAQVHDAVYYEADEDKADLVAARMTEILTWEPPASASGARIRFTAKGNHADNWKDAA